MVLGGGGGRVQLDKSRDVIYFNSSRCRCSNNITITQRFGVASIARSTLSFFGVVPQRIRIGLRCITINSTHLLPIGLGLVVVVVVLFRTDIVHFVPAGPDTATLMSTAAQCSGTRHRTLTDTNIEIWAHGGARQDNYEGSF